MRVQNCNLACICLFIKCFIDLSVTHGLWFIHVLIVVDFIEISQVVLLIFLSWTFVCKSPFCERQHTSFMTGKMFDLKKQSKWVTDHKCSKSSWHSVMWPRWTVCSTKRIKEIKSKIFDTNASTPNQKNTVFQRWLHERSATYQWNKTQQL